MSVVVSSEMRRVLVVHHARAPFPKTPAAYLIRRDHKPRCRALRRAALPHELFILGRCPHPDELVKRAAEFGYRSLAITDRNSLAGVVRATWRPKSSD